MPFEGFFSPTETKDGLLTLSRVEELVSLLQQDYQNVKSLLDLAKHWVTVAKVLSVTQNISCLKHFIQLGGVKQLDRWLREAQNIDLSGSNVIFLELIIAVLDTLGKLPLDQVGNKASGIRKTVRGLVCHQNPEIRKKVGGLFDSWVKVKEMDVEVNGIEKVRVLQGCENRISNSSSTVTDHTSCQRFNNIQVREYHGAEVLAENDGKESQQQQSVSSAGSEKYELKQVAIHDGSIRSSGKDSGDSQADMNLVATGTDDSLPVENPCFGSSVNNGGRTSGDEVITKSVQDQLVGNQSAVSKTNDEEKANAINSRSSTVKQLDGNPMSSEQVIRKERTSSPCRDHEKDDMKETSITDVDSAEYWKRIMQHRPEKNEDVCSSSTPGNTAGALQGTEDSITGSSHEVEAHNSNDTKKEFSKSEIKKVPLERASFVADKDSSTLVPRKQKTEESSVKGLEKDLAYGVLDALEVARQVAKEVEQEVGIYREASYSSGSKEVDGEMTNPSTADSIDPQKSSMDDIGSGESRDDENASKSSLSSETSTETQSREESSCSEERNVAGATSSPLAENDNKHDQESSQLMPMPQESILNEKRFLSFDLNDDVQMDEANVAEHSQGAALSPQINNVSAPIPVRSPVNLPIRPLQFDGELGWRGSAATSAFRRASPRQTPEKVNEPSTEEKNCTHRTGSSSHKLDLNIADEGDEAAVAAIDLFPEKHVPVSSSLYSRDSSVEVNSKRPERINLDLNRTEETEDNCQNLHDWRTDHELRRHQRESESVSSRSPLRNFDLNDNPEVYDQSSSQVSDAGRESKLRDPVISLMGSKIRRPEADSGITPRRSISPLSREYGLMHQGKEFLTSPHPFMFASPGAISPMGQLSRTTPHAPPTLPYAQPSFPYGGLGLGMNMPYSSAMYASGAVPNYMVDSRGTVVPHMLSSGAALAPFQRAPFLMGGVPGTSFPGDPSIKPTLDLNAGATTLFEVDRDAGARNFFLPASHSSAEEHMKSLQQVPMSGSALKRKEPDSGWGEAYQIGYQKMPWSK